MNVMAQAHKMVKEFFATYTYTGDLIEKITYAKAFASALKKAHAMNKEERKAVELFRLDTIAKFEKRVVELQALALTPDAKKYMVVCGDPHPMPIDFDAKDPKWPWAQVENATKWNSIQFANANASKVVNGNQQVGKAVLVGTHIEWDIAQLEKLINELKSA